jgi:exocyst complex component 8
MSEGRSLTLRKKGKGRPQISRPQPTSKHGQKPSLGSNNLSAPLDRNGPSETTDIVKRRYSTRYNQLPDFSQGAPAVPILPGQFKRSSRAASPRRLGPASAAGPIHVDVDTLSEPGLQHEKYVTDLLSNASEQDIQEYQDNLRRVKNRTSLDLQQNVYQNRTQFIKISKEAEKLKSEMAVLQGLMSELTVALGQTNTDSTTNGLKLAELNGDMQSRRRANRSSVANLESMWNVQLQALWKNVERSQKFLPAIPGRHIILENGSWIELDSATWKPKRPVHIVLLNDHLLVASKKRKRMDPNVPQTGPVPTKLVAEECWPLQDIDLVDMAANIASGGGTTPAEERAITAAITVRYGGKSFTYRHDKRDESAMNLLLLIFRKTVEDLRKASRAETEKPSPQIDALNYFASRDPASAKRCEIIDNINSSKDRPEVFIEVNGKQQNLRWVEGQIDELDIDIALQRFELAVEKIENLRNAAKSLKANSVAQELITVKVDERAARVAAVLSRELVETPAFPESTKLTTRFLIKLGFEDRAREVFLRARTDNLTKRARQCVFEGDLLRYVFQISYVYFTMIKNTILIYQACFAPIMMSACIKWARDHLETFNSILRRQLSTVERGGKVWRECMDVVWGHEREMLGEAGLEFREVVGRGLEIKVADENKTSTQPQFDKRSQSRSKSRAQTPK